MWYAGVWGIQTAVYNRACLSSEHAPGCITSAAVSVGMMGVGTNTQTCYCTEDNCNMDVNTVHQSLTTTTTTTARPAAGLLYHSTSSAHALTTPLILTLALALAALVTRI